MPYRVTLEPYAEIDVTSDKGEDGSYTILNVRGKKLVAALEKDVELHAPSKALAMSQILPDIKLIGDALIAGKQVWIYFGEHDDEAFWFAKVKNVRRIS